MIMIFRPHFGKFRIITDVQLQQLLMSFYFFKNQLFLLNLSQFMQKQQQGLNQAKKAYVQKQQTKYYRPSQVIKGCFSSTFEPRFPQIRDSFITKGLCAALKAFYQWRRGHVNRGVPEDIVELDRQLPINKNPNFKCANNKIRYTWIGHSTAVIAVGDNINLLIDPVFSERCSPFQCLGPKRFRETPCQISDLPKIDMVLVSHDHYDHLDQNSIFQLHKLFNPEFVVGLQSQDCFPKNSKIHLLDWTQTKKIMLNGLQFEVTFVPVGHWSRRWMFDQGKRLWGGFIIKTPKGKTIFYPGDTGYCDIFKQIGEIFGEFDLCIIPIGAYEPRELLKAQHFNPQDAVIVHKQLKSKKSVGVHWGTFPLGYQHWHAARDDLKEAAKKHGLKQDQFITVGHGNSFQIDY